MKIDPYRLLAFAFASSDLFIEIEGDGRMGLALGAGQKVCGRAETDLAGQDWRQIIAPDDQAMVEAVIAGLGSAERRGPFPVQIVHPSGAECNASLSLGRLPPLTTVSMALALSAAEPPRVAGALMTPDQFTSEAELVVARARNAGTTLELSLVEMAGLEAARATLAPSEAARLDRQIVGAMRAQAYAGALVGKLDGESYALVRPSGDSEAQMTERLNQSLKAMIGDLCNVGAKVRPFTLPGKDKPQNSVLALKHAMDAIARDGAPEGLSLAEAFSQSIERTMTQAIAFRQAVAHRRFRLAYQPVVDLKTDTLHHHEVLVRFGDGASPMDTILMAEELDLIEQLDLAVLDETLKVMKGGKAKLKLAVNISGRSISDGAFVAQLRLAAKKLKTPRNLIFEVTESSRIEDFTAVDRHIQSLRGDGHIVCLDDFGAGAASLAYLQRLQVDVVKVDGQYVKTLTEPREMAMVSHLVSMCRELGVQTIAEMVETQDLADAARKAGFDFAQGYLFGKPAAKPEPLTLPSAAPVSRRRGLIEQWG